MSTQSSQWGLGMARSRQRQLPSSNSIAID